MTVYLASSADPNTWPAAAAYIAMFVCIAAVAIAWIWKYHDDDGDESP